MQIPFIDTPLLLMDRQLDRLESIVTHFKSELEELNLDPHSLSLYGHSPPEETQELISQFSGNDDRIEDIGALSKRKSIGHRSPRNRQSSLGRFLVELKEKVLEAKGNVEVLSRKLENPTSPCWSPLARELPSPEGARIVKRVRSGSLGGVMSTEISRGELLKNEKNGGKLMEFEGLRKENGELKGEIESLRRENELLRKKLGENGEKDRENQKDREKHENIIGDEIIFEVLGFFF